MSLVDNSASAHSRYSENSTTYDERDCFVPFRPVQYLGSKIRVLDEIRNAVRALVPRGGRVGDLFAGSTVVSQYLASDGYSVSAVDTQSYSSKFGISCLGIGRGHREKLNSQTIIQNAMRSKVAPSMSHWLGIADTEKVAIADSDLETLRQIYNELPLIWRDPENPFFSKINGVKFASSAKGALPLLCSIYSGSYFGVRQALDVDLIRNAIFQLSSADELTEWQESAALTALMYATSRCVHSAGKHFAQPIKSHALGTNAFAEKRLLSDRRISVINEFEGAVERINNLAYPEGISNKFLLGEAEHIAPKFFDELDLVYLDPPYTAQQYSRFYHILETLCTYQFPNLILDNKLTSGLYPSDRFKSAFCSKRAAMPAFSSIVERSCKAGASLLISYSHSATGSDGNARMLSFEDIINECGRYYGSKNVEWEGMEHSYRQFNNSRMANQKRNDPEVLIKCKIG